MADEPAIYAIATMDTKGPEIDFLAQCVARAGASVLLCDVGTQLPPTVPPHIGRDAVARHHPDDSSAVLGQSDRGVAVAAMGLALERFLLAEHEAGRLAAVVGIGGGGGTSIITRAMRALPIGLPKVMLSTMASGDTRPYVESSDITMMHSVADVAGLNRVTRLVLANAAHAVAGMLLNSLPAAPDDRRAIGLTMFGVTTPCVTAVASRLQSRGFDPLTFHATGAGGKAMEKLIASGIISAVMDITTTEIADEIVGGVLTAGPQRLDAAVHAGVPCVLSLGALDMVNFGPADTIPVRFAGRKFHVHNPQVTLMRTTPEECRLIARFISDKVNRSTAPLSILIPEHGVSGIDAPGQPFHDPAADAALFSELEACIHRTDARTLRRLPLHINDPAFADALVAEFDRITAARPHS